MRPQKGNVHAHQCFEPEDVQVEWDVWIIIITENSVSLVEDSILFKKCRHVGSPMCRIAVLSTGFTGFMAFFFFPLEKVH